MATSTTNLGLIKPAGTDKIRIAQINSNMDVIDTKMGAVGNTPLQTQVNTVNDKTKILGAPDGHYNTRYNNANGDDIDTIIGTILDAANDTNNQTFGIDVYGGAIPGVPGANRYFLLGWLNGTRKYGFVQIWAFSDFYIGLRNNADTFSIFPTSSVTKNMLGVPAMNNTHASIEKGNFAFVYNHDTLTTGLYTAKSNIAANAALSTSNLTAVSGGGLNALNSAINTKPTRESNGWTTTLSWTAEKAVSLLMINYTLLVLVWTPSTSGLSVFVVSEYGNYRKSEPDSNTILFGTHSTDTNYKIERSGTKLTLTTPDNVSAKVIS